MKRKSIAPVAIGYSAPNAPATPATAATLTAEDLGDVPIQAIRPNPANPRRHADAELAELAESIRVAGVLQPVLVRAIATSGDPAEPWYELVAGERRWRAAQLAGLEDIPARLVEVDDHQALQVALLENVQRRDLDAIDEAEGYRRLAAAGWTQAKIGEAVGRAQPTIANRIRILDLPETVQTRVRDGELSPSHAVAIARFAPFPVVAEKVAEFAVRDRWPAKHIERSPLPGSDALIAAKLAMSTHDAPFRLTCESACPHDAHVQGYCLRPDHFRQLEREAKREERATRETAIAAAHDGTARVNTVNLPYDAFVRLPGTPPAPGCTEACECRVLAQDYGREATICMDPKRYRALEAAAADERLRVFKINLAAQQTRVRSLVEHSAIGGRELALIAAPLIEEYLRWDSVEHRAAVTRHVIVRDGAHAPSLDDLAALKGLGLLRLLLEIVIDGELSTWVDGNQYRPAKKLEWYFGSPFQPPAQDLPSAGAGIVEQRARALDAYDPDEDGDQVPHDAEPDDE